MEDWNLSNETVSIVSSVSPSVELFVSIKLEEEEEEEKRLSRLTIYHDGIDEIPCKKKNEIGWNIENKKEEKLKNLKMEEWRAGSIRYLLKRTISSRLVHGAQKSRNEKDKGEFCEWLVWLATMAGMADREVGKKGMEEGGGVKEYDRIGSGQVGLRWVRWMDEWMECGGVRRRNGNNCHRLRNGKTWSER